MTLSYWRGEHHVTAFCRVSYAHKRLFRPQNETLNTKYRIKYGRNFSSEGSGFAVIANTANWHLSLGTGDGKTIKDTIFIKGKIDLQFQTDSAGNCPTVCKLGGMVVGGAWHVFERVVNLPNPKAKLPLSWYSNTPSSKQHKYECSITRT